MTRKQVQRVIGKRLFSDLRFVAAVHGYDSPEEVLRELVRGWVGENPYQRYGHLLQRHFADPQ